MDDFEKMQLAATATRLLVAELIGMGLHPCHVAATLCAAAGPLYRQGVKEHDLRLVVTSVAEGMITGQPQPMPEAGA